MDDVTNAIAGFATARPGAALGAEVIGSLTSHIVDAFGCAVAAVDEAPCRIARIAAGDYAVPRGASVIGTEARSVPDLAAFANACLVRGLDYNDTFNSTTGGHPSDMIPGIFAAVEAAGGTGLDFVEGVHVAYEVFGALADTVPLRDTGWDQGVFIGVGTAAGVAAAIRLGLDETANAVSLAVTANNSLRATRAGNLSEWKGCATPYAVQNAVTLTRLAALGMTGPDRPFRGKDGFIERVGGPIEPDRIGQRREGKTVVERTAIKFLPVEWCAQAPVELFLDRGREWEPEEVESITIAGYDFLCKEIGGGRGDAQAKWDPRTRETADHSLPYLLAVALIDRRVDLNSFLPERIADPALRPVMQKIRVQEDLRTRGLFPERQPVRVSIAMRDGRVITAECEYPLGHPQRPAADRDVDAKFLRMAGRTVDASAASRLLAELRGVADAPDLERIATLLRSVPTASA